jgi:hypothetical protein
MFGGIIPRLFLPNSGYCEHRFSKPNGIAQQRPNLLISQGLQLGTPTRSALRKRRFLGKMGVLSDD